MQIVVDFPPNYAEINAAFGLERRGARAIFAWGDRIFNPHAINVVPCLIAHEQVHGARQGADVDGWWRRYIDDPAFRLAEEIPAHAAEYHVLVGAHGNNRNARRQYLARIASRMAAPLYGYNPPLSAERARAYLKRALEAA
jgi:hypothetical protein